MKRLAAGLLIASLFMAGCGKTGENKTVKTGEKTAVKTEAEKTKTT